MTSVTYYVYWDAITDKEVRKRYPKPVSMVQARADAIALLRSGKVTEPPYPFSMMCVVLMREPKPGEGKFDNILARVTLQKHYPRVYDETREEWLWLYDNGKVRPDPWGRR